MNLRAAYLRPAFLAALTLGYAPVCEAASPKPAGPAWARNLPIYETSLELSTPNGKFREFQQRLDALKDLGVGIIWFLPIFPRGGNPPDKPPSNSAYCVRDYYDVNPAHGTKEEFRHLVAAVHARGMYVMMDWVPNHTSWGNGLIKLHPEFYRKDKDGQIVHPGPWKDVAQLDYSNRQLWEYMYQARKYWIENFGADGFREDVAEAVPLEHWLWLRPKLNALKPVLMLAEADTPRLHPAFDMTYDWSSQCNYYMIARGDWPASSLDKMLGKEGREFPVGAVRMRHLTNHDMAYLQYAWDNRVHLDAREYPYLEQTSLPKKYGPGDRAFAVLCATLPNSRPMVWNGQELGLLANTPKLRWNDSPYLEFYRKLLHAYRENPALYEGDFHRIAIVKSESVYAFWRSAGSNRAVVIVNLGNQPQHLVLNAGLIAGRYMETFTSSPRNLPSDAVDLGPWEYRLYLTGTPGRAGQAEQGDKR